MPFNNPMHRASVPFFGNSWTKFLFIEIVGNFTGTVFGLTELNNDAEGFVFLRMPNEFPTFVLKSVRRVPANLPTKDFFIIFYGIFGQGLKKFRFLKLDADPHPRLAKCLGNLAVRVAQYEEFYSFFEFFTFWEYPNFE